MPDTPLNPSRYGEFPPNFYPPYPDLNGIAPSPYTTQPHSTMSNTPQRAAFNFDPTAGMQANQGSQAPLARMDTGAGTPGSTGSARPRTVDLGDIEDDEQPPTKKLKSINEYRLFISYTLTGELTVSQSGHGHRRCTLRCHVRYVS